MLNLPILNRNNYLRWKFESLVRRDMKKFLFIALSVLLFACSEKQPGFTIKVQLDGANGKVLLEENDGGSLAPVDSADIVDGVAVLKGAVDYPHELYLSVLGQRQKTIIFVENTKMNVVGNADSLNRIKVSGSATHDEYQKLKDEIIKAQQEYTSVYMDARDAIASGDTVKGKDLLQKVNDMYEKSTLIPEEFVKNNPSSYVDPGILVEIQEGKEADELDALFSGLDPKIQEVPSMVELKKRIEMLKAVAVGQIAPDFTQNDPDGNPVKFSDVYSKNEVTLLDFWASWCQPCRAENPNVVAVFNDYKGKGFGVFGVSLDMDKDSWLKAIDTDKLHWTQVSDLSYWNNPVAQKYAVNAIPSNLLVDKNGRIIAKDKRDDELRETVAKILD